MTIKSNLMIVAVLFATSATMMSCNSTADKVDNAKSDVADAANKLEEAKANYAVQYKQFRMESDAKTAYNDSLIADMKMKMKDKKDVAKADYEKTISELDQKNEALKALVRNTKNEGNDKWDNFKKDFMKDVDAVGQSLKDFSKRNLR